MTLTESTPSNDLQPDAHESKKYWENVEPTDNGMLGGFTKIHHVDIQESRKLLSEYFNPYKKPPAATFDLINSCTKSSCNNSYDNNSNSSSNNNNINIKGDTELSSPATLGHPVSTPPSTTAATSCLASLAPLTTAKCGSSDESFLTSSTTIATTTGTLVVSSCTSETNKLKRQRTRNKYRQAGHNNESNLKDCDAIDTRHKSQSKECQSVVLKRRTGVHALDCGAGIGRITKSVLLAFSNSVDLLEQNEAFLRKSIEYIGLEDGPRVGKLIASSLQSFDPPREYTYDIIWVQWVTGYLSDTELVTFFSKCASRLTRNNGLIFVKDNVTSQGEIDADMNDSSITRPRNLLESLFAQANLQILQVRKQVKFPRGLYPVYMWVLEAKDSS